jgi:phenylpropionate dioxygenase-like ring-hydroxylating dioxygenase large terminal subunit
VTNPRPIFGAFSGQWLPVMLAGDLGVDPLRVTVLGFPIVVWRSGDGTVSAVVDRCPHRAAKLSEGKITANGLRCPYHGWVFDKFGRNPRCNVPLSQPESVCIDYFSTRELLGIIWIAHGAVAHDPLPGLLPASPKINYAFDDLTDANILDVAENFMDITHFAFVHQGTFSQASLAVSPDALTVREEPFGFSCDYEVTVMPNGAFRAFLGDLVQSVSVRSLFVAPVSQLFHVTYNSGIHYSSLQTVLPVSSRLSRMIQVAFSADDGLDSNLFKAADQSIWREDKAIVESLQVVVPDDWYDGQKAELPSLNMSLRERIAQKMGISARLDAYPQDCAR